MHRKTLWTIVTVVELVAAAAVILLDLFLPTLVILVLAFVSLLVRREKIRSLGRLVDECGQGERHLLGWFVAAGARRSGACGGRERGGDEPRAGRAALPPAGARAV
jgi:hypothetical protein